MRYSARIWNTKSHTDGRILPWSNNYRFYGLGLTPQIYMAGSVLDLESLRGVFHFMLRTHA